MRSYALLGFILPTYALVAYQPCLTTTALPLITVVGGPDGYHSQYTRTYQEFCPSGLTKKTYTITETCSSIDCHAAPIETVPPPGFTHAVVKCSACGGQGTQVAILTFPTESVEAYSSSGYIIEPLDVAQATKAWIDQVNVPGAMETVEANPDEDSNANTGSPAPDSSEQNGSQLQVPSSQGAHEDQQHNGSLGITDSDHAATEYTGSADGNGGSNDQIADRVGGSSNAQGSGSGDTTNGSGSEGSGDGTIPQHGPSSPPATEDSTESNGQGSNVPVGAGGVSDAGSGDASTSHAEGGTESAPANPQTSPSEGGSSSSPDATSVDGEPKNKNNTNNPADTTSSDATDGSSDDVSDSGVVSPPSPQNSTPSDDNSSPQSSSDNSDADRYNVPQTVSAAGSNKVNVFTCTLTSVATIFIIWLL